MSEELHIKDGIKENTNWLSEEEAKEVRNEVKDKCLELELPLYKISLNEEFFVIEYSPKKMTYIHRWKKIPKSNDGVTISGHIDIDEAILEDIKENQE